MAAARLVRERVQEVELEPEEGCPWQQVPQVLLEAERHPVQLPQDGRVYPDGIILDCREYRSLRKAYIEAVLHGAIGVIVARSQCTHYLLAFESHLHDVLNGSLELSAKIGRAHV